MSSKRRIFLSPDQHYALRKYLDENREALQKLDHPRLAREAVKSLGFDMSEHHVKEARKCVGYPALHGSHGVATQATNSMRIRVIRDSVMILYKRLGEVMPEDLRAMFDKEAASE